MFMHDEHPDIQAYNKSVSISDIVMGEQKEPDDPDAEEQRKRQLTHVKREEEVELRGSREPNPGICQHMKGMQVNKTAAHRAKKQRTAH